MQTATTIAQEKGDSPREYYQARLEIVETLAVSSALELAESVGGDLHVVGPAIAQVARLLRGRDPTGGTAPHDLAFTAEDFVRIGAVLKVVPTVK